MTDTLLSVMPEIALLTGACIVLLVDLFVSDANKHRTFWLTQITLLVCAWITLRTANVEPVRSLHGLVIDDMLSDLLKFFTYIAISLMLFYSRSYLMARGLFRGETFVLTLFTLL